MKSKKARGQRAEISSRKFLKQLEPKGPIQVRSAECGVRHPKPETQTAKLIVVHVTQEEVRWVMRFLSCTEPPDEWDVPLKVLRRVVPVMQAVARGWITQ